ncbi:MAG: hypothetical protein OEZ06_11170 [Myxococcales bacterium]|nr:hypothetical protein [Myxococcales bacterium]
MAFTPQPFIHALSRQITVLIAQLAACGGLRAALVSIIEDAAAR